MLDFLTRPVQLRSDVRSWTLGGEAVILLSQDQEVTFDDPVLAAVVPQLAGPRTVSELVQSLELSPPQVFQALIVLHEKGFLLSESAPKPTLRVDLRWLSQSPRDAWESVFFDHSGLVRQRGEDPPQAPPWGGGPTLVRGGAAADLLLVAVDDYLDLRLAQQPETPWLLVRPTGPENWFGPWFAPGQTACWECLRHRLERNRPSFALARSLGEPLPLPVSRNSTTLRAFAGICAMQAARGRPPETAILAWDWLAATTSRHALQRRPQCPVCGSPRPLPERPIQLSAQASRRDGEHAGPRPEAQLQAWQHLVSPVTGIVPSLVDIGTGIVSVFTARNTAIRADGLLEYRQLGRNWPGGKGATAAQARVSCLAEACERYCCWWDEPQAVVRRASYRELGSAALHPNEIMLFSQAQLESRTGFDENHPCQWTRAWSLTRQEWRWLPAACVYFGHPEQRGNHSPFVAETNGNAAGSSLEDAILSGFWEIVERDAIAQWWYNRLHRPEVDLEALDPDFVGELRREYAQAGRQFWVLDLSADLPVPCFAAVCAREEGEEAEIGLGFGCHPVARLAVLRALSEMSQCLPRSLALAPREDRPLRRTRFPLREHGYLRPAGKARLPDSLEPQGDLRKEVEACQGLVEAAGMEMLVLEMTRPDIAIPTVKVIVPGMRLHWRRLAPGRLYDVPVALGRLARPHREEELNAADVFQ